MVIRNVADLQRDMNRFTDFSASTYQCSLLSKTVTMALVIIARRLNSLIKTQWSGTVIALRRTRYSTDQWAACLYRPLCLDEKFNADYCLLGLSTTAEGYSDVGYPSEVCHLGRDPYNPKPGQRIVMLFQGDYCISHGLMV